MLIKDPEFEESMKRSKEINDYCYNQIRNNMIEGRAAYEEACTRLKDFKVKKHSKEMDTVLSIGMLLFQR